MKVKTYIQTTIHSLLYFIISAFLFSSNATAYKKGDVIVRAGAATVAPSVSSSNVTLGGSELADTGVDVENDTQLGLIATYMLNNQLGLSLLASTPFAHDISGENIGIDNVGTADQLPPTLTIDYFPANPSSVWQPHFGIGLNYTIFFSEDTAQELDNALGNSSLDLTNSLGLALKVGLDYKITDHFGINASIFWIDIDTDATIQSSAGTVEVDVDIDPIVYLLSATYRF